MTLLLPAHAVQKRSFELPQVVRGRGVLGCEQSGLEWLGAAVDGGGDLSTFIKQMPRVGQGFVSVGQEAKESKHPLLFSANHRDGGVLGIGDLHPGIDERAPTRVAPRPLRHEAVEGRE